MPRAWCAVCVDLLRARRDATTCVDVACSWALWRCVGCRCSCGESRLLARCSRVVEVGGGVAACMAVVVVVAVVVVTAAEACVVAWVEWVVAWVECAGSIWILESSAFRDSASRGQSGPSRWEPASARAHTSAIVGQRLLHTRAAAPCIHAIALWRLLAWHGVCLLARGALQPRLWQLTLRAACLGALV